MSWTPQPRPEISRQKLMKEYWRGFWDGLQHAALIGFLLWLIFSAG